MQARITGATQVIDRSGDTPERKILFPRMIVVDKGKEVAGKVVKGKDGEPDTTDYREAVTRVPQQDIFKLIDAGKAKPSTQKDLEMYRRRGGAAATVDDEEG